MSMEKHNGPELQPGEFEFSLVIGAFKAKFASAIEEQAEMSTYRVFTLDRIQEARDALARFRLVDANLVHDLQAAAQNPGAVIDVALPIAYPDSTNPVLLSDTPLGDKKNEYFVLYKQDVPTVIDAEHMQERILDVDPDFMSRALRPNEVVPMRKPNEQEQ